jgi:hypothetical protein
LLAAAGSAGADCGLKPSPVLRSEQVSGGARRAARAQKRCEVVTDDAGRHRQTGKSASRFRPPGRIQRSLDHALADRKAQTAKQPSVAPER